MKVKKFSLCLVLCLALLMGTFVFTACDDEGYLLSSFYSDYSKIVESHEILSLDENNEIVVDYSLFKADNTTYFSSALSSVPYSNLTNFYNPLLNYSLYFVSNYIEQCSVAKIDVSKEDRNNLKSALDEFEVALNSMYLNTENVAELLKGGETTSNVHMIRLANLFESYENLYMACFNLSRELSNIYFNYAISDANPNYSLLTLSEFDASRVVVNLRSKIVNQIVNITENYVQQNVRGLKLYSTLTTDNSGSYPSVPTSFSAYKSAIDSINVSFSSSIGTTINSSEQKESFYEASIAQYNIQSNISNLQAQYAIACNEIVYSIIIADENATNYQLTCVKVIEDYSALIEQNTTALRALLSIISEISE